MDSAQCEDEAATIRELRKAVNSVTALVGAALRGRGRARRCGASLTPLSHPPAPPHPHQMLAVEADLEDMGDNYSKLAQVLGPRACPRVPAADPRAHSPGALMGSLAGQPPVGGLPRPGRGLLRVTRRGTSAHNRLQVARGRSRSRSHSRAGQAAWPRKPTTYDLLPCPPSSARLWQKKAGRQKKAGTRTGSGAAACRRRSCGAQRRDMCR